MIDMAESELHYDIQVRIHMHLHIFWVSLDLIGQWFENVIEYLDLLLNVAELIFYNNLQDPLRKDRDSIICML